MLTDLLVAGLMVAAAPHAPGPETAKAPVRAPHSQAASGPQACHGEAREGTTMALLEAHASFAAMPPFSLARLGAAAGVQPGTGTREKDAAGCKS